MTKALDTPLVRIVDDDAEQLKSLHSCCVWAAGRS